jgi:preprotein translocase subunit SecA
MNDQRKVVFEQRREMMAKDSLEEMIDDMRQGVVDDLIAKHVPPDAYPESWDTEGLAHSAEAAFNLSLPLADWAKEEGITEDDMRERLQKAADEAYAARVAKNGPEVTRYIEKQVVLQALDHLWREHLVTLDHLRQVVGWRGMAQRDPLNEYKSEAFQLFDELIGHLRLATTSQLSRVEVAFEPAQPQDGPPSGFLQAGAAGAAFEGPSGIAPPPGFSPGFGAEEAGSTATLVRPARGDAEDGESYAKVGRNQPCPCGSGKKYKHCHGALA